MELSRIGDRPPNASDRVSNGRRLLIGVDGRTAWARRFRALVAAHADDLGGADQITASQQSMIRRAATLEIELERLEASFATAEQDKPSGCPGAAHLDQYSRLSGQLRRVLDSLAAQSGKAKAPPAPVPGVLERILGEDYQDEEEEDEQGRD
jgi:hypothetical protein